MTEHLPNIPGYDVEAEIGRGGMGVVYRVRRHEDGAILALKMILRGRGASFGEFVRFRVEAEALTCLDHPNIVAIRGVGLYAGYPYLTLEFAERGSLRQVSSRGPQKPRWAAEVVRTVALAVHHAHDRGMLHRDLKPANVLLMADGTPKVTDFGLVKFADPIDQVAAKYGASTAWVNMLDMELRRFAAELGAQYGPAGDSPALSEDDFTESIWDQCAARTGILGDRARLHSVRAFLSEAKQQGRRGVDLYLDVVTQPGTVMGTPSYMAPEQALGELARIGPRSDVYALGGILYELLTGRPPFSAQTMLDLLSQVCKERPTPPRQLVPAISPDIEAVCLKCLEKQPESRYQTAAAVAEDLGRFLDGFSPRAVAAVAGGIPPVKEPVVSGEQKRTCPSCSAELPEDAVPCIHCGYDFHLGTNRQMETVSAKPNNGELGRQTDGKAVRRRPRARRWSPVLLLGGVLCALLGGCCIFAGVQPDSGPVRARVPIAFLSSVIIGIGTLLCWLAYRVDEIGIARPERETSEYKSFCDVPWYRQSPGWLVFLAALLFPPITIALCVICLTGDVYTGSYDEDGNLQVWGVGNKVAAVLILVIHVCFWVVLWNSR